MVNKRWRVGGLAILLVLGGWWQFRHGEERAIRRAWRNLIEHCRQEGPASLLQTAGRATGVLSFFATGAVVEVGAPHPMTIQRAELPALLQRAWTYAERVEIQPRGETFPHKPGPNEAVMETTVELAVTVDGRREAGLEPYQIHWRRSGRVWRITRIERLTPVRHPGLPTGEETARP